MRHRALLVVILIVLVGIAWFGYSYANRQAFLSNDSLPPPPEQGPIKFAGPTPANSFHVEEGNVLARTVFDPDAPGNAHVQIRDCIFTPMPTSTLWALPRAA